MDLWRPYKVQTIEGFHCFLTVVDDCTQTTWVFLLRCKDDTILHVKKVISLVKKSVWFHC